MSDLKFIRIFDPIHIPNYLIDQIKDKHFDAEKFYKYQQGICTFKENEKIVINPYNLLFVAATPDKIVKGFVWAVVDVLNSALCINNYSIDRKYWGKGTALKLLTEWALEIKNGAKLDRIYWITKNTKYCEKYGFTKSKNVLYEFTEHKEGLSHGTDTDGDTSKADRRRQPISSRTTKLSQPNFGGDGESSAAVV